jgi:hypothetical protein
MLDWQIFRLGKFKKTNVFLQKNLADIGRKKQFFNQLMNGNHQSKFVNFYVRKTFRKPIYQYEP